MFRLTALLVAAALSLALAGTALASDTTTGADTDATTEAPHHGHGFAGTPITGDTATSAQATALAAVPGTVLGTYSVTSSCGNSDVAYAVEIKQEDGTIKRVLEDSAFVVLSTRTIPAATGTTTTAKKKATRKKHSRKSSRKSSRKHSS